MQIINQSEKTARSWKQIKNAMENLECYTLEDTIINLKKDNLYLNLEGKAKNRTLMKSDLRLYKSIMQYTQSLEEAFKKQNSYKTSYNFSHRVKFIIEKSLKLDQLKCKSGKKYTWNSYSR